MRVSRKLSLAALCVGMSGLLHAQTGTSNGSYHFGGVSTTANSGGTGFRVQGDKFAVTNNMANPTSSSPEMSSTNTATNTDADETVILKANGSTVRSFLLKDIAIRNVTGNFPLKKFTVTIIDAYGNPIATHALNSTNQTMRDTAVNISSFGFLTNWPAAGYPYAASVKIEYQFVNTNRAASNLRFVRWNLADISGDAPPFVSTGAANAGTLCAGGSVSVAFTGGANFGAGNVYALQLSDASGSFASPVTIGTLASNAASGSISGTIPVNTPEGSGYRVRITGSAPAYTSLNDNGSNLLIRANATAAGVSSQALCAGGSTTSVSFSGNASATDFTWTNDNASIGIAASGSGTIPSFTATNNTNTVQTGNFTITPVNNGCNGTPTSFSISVKPTPGVNAVSNIQACASSAVSATLSGGVAGTSFSWTNDNTGIGLAASGTGDISFTSSAVTSQQSATISVNTEADGCPGGSTSFTITVNPTPAATISYASPIAERLGSASVTHSGTGGGTYSSTTGLVIDASTGAIDLAASTPGTYTVTYTVAAAGGCGEYQTNTSVTLLPFGATIAYAGAPFCGTTGTATVTRTGTPGGTYSAASGLVIDAQTGTIDIAASQAGTYTVTYTVGPDFVQTVLAIRPAVLVNGFSNQVFCAGATTSQMVITGAPGLTFSWTNDNTSIGLAASGNDVVPAFPATNNGSIQEVANITLKAAGGTGCDLRKGASYRYTVKPVPSVPALSNQTLCAGSSTTSVTLTSPIEGAAYVWTNDNTNIGLGALGTGTIPPFVAQNNTGTLQIATITVIPKAGGCAGISTPFTYTVSPSAGSLSYTGSPYCPSGPAYPVRTGSGGGTFTATPSGLMLDPTVGTVNLALSNPGTYTVTYSVGASASCISSISTSITIKPLATVNGVPNQVYCQNVATSPVVFTGTATTYSWSTDNTSIGISAGGTNVIPSFTTVNISGIGQGASIRVTPISTNSSYCTGKTITFRFLINYCTQPAVTTATRVAESSTVRLSPNPAQGAVTVQLDRTEGGSYSVQVLTQNGLPASAVTSFTGRSYSINTSMLTPGAYFVQIVNLKTKEVTRKQLFKL